MPAKPAKPVLGGREKVKVAIAQKSPVFMNLDASVERAASLILEAGRNGAQLVVFPEAWLAGYPYWTEGWDSALPQWAGGRILFRDNALVVPSEQAERLAQAVRKAGIYVVLGCNEMDPRPAVSTVYNSLIFFAPDGSVMGRHRKLMPTFTERMFWGHGDADDLVVFDTDIGRIGGLICGEHLMTLVRASMIAQGEDIHVAVFPGAFELHTGPRLEEPEKMGCFWGHFEVRAHAFEAGAFVVSACASINDDDVAADFPYKGKMNIGYANGGSEVVAPLGIALAGPTYGEAMVYAELEAWMIKATKAIVDTMGHYARPDVLRLLMRREEGWVQAGAARDLAPLRTALNEDALKRAADARDVDSDKVIEIAEGVRRAAG
ncbi:MAG TPA: carbon-nitrogen hydrolase family protein [Burkholderiaceae bacterium]|nr:carbon-nitrogen hydrolase family protein [Burkholderiaceae bacterium]